MAHDAARLALIAEAKEPVVVTRQSGREFRTVIWVVVDNEDVFVRSFLGDDGKWYKRALSNSAVDLEIGDASIPLRAVAAVDEDSVKRASDGFRSKYPPGRNVDAMVRDEVLHTTLRLDPT